MCGGGGKKGPTQTDVSQRKTNLTRQAEQDMISQVQRGRDIRRTQFSVIEESHGKDKLGIGYSTSFGSDPTYMTQEEAAAFKAKSQQRIAAAKDSTTAMSIAKLKMEIEEDL